MTLHTFALAAAASIMLASPLLAATLARAEPSTDYASLAAAAAGVKANCGDTIHDPDSTSFVFPPNSAITLARCHAQKGDLCWAEDHAMGGRWSRELICAKGSVALGGFPSTYRQGRNQ